MLVCFDGRRRRHYVPSEVREAETAAAIQILGCEYRQLHVPCDPPDWDALEAILRAQEPSRVWAPLPEQHGHSQHNGVGEMASRLWPGRVEFYSTYTMTAGRSRIGEPAWVEDGWPELKRQALACYVSQLARPGTAAHFERGLDEYVLPARGPRTAGLTLPRFNGWMIPDDALEIVCRLIDARRPKLIVETGSGRSTVVLAAALRELGRGRLVSLEHQVEFHRRTDDMIATNGLRGFAEVRHAPLIGDWYDPRGWTDLCAIDMLVVDGPPGHVGPLARRPALPLLRDRLTPGAVVVLDDTNRADEQATLRDWEAFGLASSEIVRHSTGALAYGSVS